MDSAPPKRDAIADGLAMGPPIFSATQLRHHIRPLPTHTNAAARTSRPAPPVGPVTPARFLAAAAETNSKMEKRRGTLRKKPLWTHRDGAKVAEKVRVSKENRAAEREEKGRRRKREEKVPEAPGGYVRDWVMHYVRIRRPHGPHGKREEYRKVCRDGMARGRGARGARVDGVGVRGGGVDEARVPEIKYVAGTMGVDGDFLEEMMGVRMECERMWAEWYAKAAKELEGSAKTINGEGQGREKKKRRSERKGKKEKRKAWRTIVDRLGELRKFMVTQGDDEAAAKICRTNVKVSQGIIAV